MSKEELSLSGGQEENNDTIADVPDAFDDEETVNEPTLTVGSEGQVSSLKSLFHINLWLSEARG